MQPIVLMRDKGYEMQVPFALGASGQLKDLGFDDAIGIVSMNLDVCTVDKEPPRNELRSPINAGQSTFEARATAL